MFLRLITNRSLKEYIKVIISKTPYRISLFGGGTDYPNWYLKITDKFYHFQLTNMFTFLAYLPNFFPHNFRILYAKDEKVNKINEITHPSVRETLKHINFKENLEIHYDGDLPARCGLDQVQLLQLVFKLSSHYKIKLLQKNYLN